MVIYILGGPEHGQQQQPTRQRINLHSRLEDRCIWAIKTIDGPISLDRDQSVCEHDDRFDAMQIQMHALKKNLVEILEHWMRCARVRWWQQYVMVGDQQVCTCSLSRVSRRRRSEHIKAKQRRYRKMHSSVGWTERMVYLPVEFRSHQNTLPECMHRWVCECVRFGRCIKLNK